MATMRPLHLLLIEDDPDSADAMSLLLRTRGVDVDWVGSGEDALEFFRRGRARSVDVILLDIMLPDTDGASLVAQLSQIAPLPPIVIHSASSEARVAKTGAQVHAIAVLRKPTDWGKLLTLLEGCRRAERAAG
jgi:DNA-binding response OmpR family regulator